VEKSHEKLALTVMTTESWQQSHEQLAEALLEVTATMTMTGTMRESHKHVLA